MELRGERCHDANGNNGNGTLRGVGINSDNNVDYEKLGFGVTIGMDAVGFSANKANFIRCCKDRQLKAKHLKAFTRSGTVIGAIAGGAPALYHIFNGNVTWRDGVALGFAGLGVASEFFGVGEIKLAGLFCFNDLSIYLYIRLSVYVSS